MDVVTKETSMLVFEYRAVILLTDILHAPIIEGLTYKHDLTMTSMTSGHEVN